MIDQVHCCSMLVCVALSKGLVRLASAIPVCCCTAGCRGFCRVHARGGHARCTVQACARVQIRGTLPCKCIGYTYPRASVRVPSVVSWPCMAQARCAGARACSGWRSASGSAANSKRDDNCSGHVASFVERAQAMTVEKIASLELGRHA